MKLKSKKLTFISIILMVLGLILFTIAFIATQGKIGAYLDTSGIHYSYAEGSGNQSDAYDLPDFKGIDVTYAGADVTLCASDHYGISYENGTNNKSPKVEVVNDILLITQPSNAFSINLFTFNFKSTKIVVYYPKDSDFSKVDLSVTSGNVSISEINADKFDLSVVDGYLELTDIEAETITLSPWSTTVYLNNIKADKLTYSNTDGKSVFNHMQIMEEFKIDVGSGKVELNDVTAEYLNMKAIDIAIKGTDLVTNGLEGSGFSSTFDLAGDFNGNSNLSNVDGRTNLSLSGSYTDYNYNLKTLDGSISMNGEKQSGSVKDNNNSENNINIDQTSGKIQIEFAK